MHHKIVEITTNILIENLRESGWTNKLKGFLFSQDFTDLVKALHDLTEDGKRFTPPMRRVFANLEACPVDKVKVVMINWDPYNILHQATGLAWSFTQPGTLPGEIKTILETVDKEALLKDPDQSPDLLRWENQGVLLLNLNFTTEIGKYGNHIDIWKPFLGYLLGILNEIPEVIFVFTGQKTEPYSVLIDDDHLKIMVESPAAAAASKRSWNSKDLFNVINEELRKQGEGEILW